ncbi:MAG: DUF4403 family protein [Bacteroidetes bacterium]|nr:DUF4403 family protein [Bacteroidota bacterium]MBS1931791.1 DUF4403 family protein [Bacteroidota bacterium]
MNTILYEFISSQFLFLSFFIFIAIMKNMKGKAMIFLILLLFISASCSHKINPAEPVISVTEINKDSLPDSEINIPFQIDLKPFYILAEKNIDTVFNSPGYPDNWVHDGCSSRYMYTFRRGPLQMKVSGNSLNLGFTGFYKVIGSTRACINGTAISPWTPPCKCGFTEGDRKVNVTFVNTFRIQPDYKIRISINRSEPQPLNKCEVCFWGQDITSHVMKELKSSLDDAKKNMELSYGTIDLRSKFQALWNQLNKSINVYNIGWLQIHPQQLHVNGFFAFNDSLYISLGVSAKPVISFEKPGDQYSAIPDLSNSSAIPGFNIFLDAVLQYDSLSSILNDQIEGHEFELNKGPVKKKFVVRSCRLSGSGNDNLIIKVDFGGSAEGTAYFTGQPSYDPSSHILELKNLDFDVKTKDKFLKTASWLFNKKITDELSSYTRFDLTSFLDLTKLNLSQQLNREWMPGIRSYGMISNVNLAGIYPKNQFLVLRSNCTGLLSFKITSERFNF